VAASGAAAGAGSPLCRLARGEEENGLCSVDCGVRVAAGARGRVIPSGEAGEKGSLAAARGSAGSGVGAWSWTGLLAGRTVAANGRAVEAGFGSARMVV